jgi:phage-related protein
MPVACHATTLQLGTLAVQVTATGSTAVRHLAVQFGDGYSDRRPDGINTTQRRWSLATPPAPIEDVLALEAELEALGVGKFQWAPPGEAAARWWELDPVSWERVYASDDLASLSFSIRSVPG